MRLKEFIIFIIIFTIVYFFGFYIYDCIKNKKDMKKNELKKLDLLNIEMLNKFASFYNKNISIDNYTLLKMYDEFKNLIDSKLSILTNEYNISLDELIVIISFMEYYGLINTRSINTTLDSIRKINENEETLILKYKLLFTSKPDYKTLLMKAGFGSEKEIKKLVDNYLIPGIKIENETIEYLGDDYE